MKTVTSRSVPVWGYKAKSPLARGTFAFNAGGTVYPRCRGERNTCSTLFLLQLPVKPWFQASAESTKLIGFYCVSPVNACSG